MDIAFVHLGPKFDGDTLTTRALGGTETALIGVSRALAKEPAHRVRVFTNTDRPGIYDGVEYLPPSALAKVGGAVDVLVSIREWLPLVAPIRARHRVLFSPDAYDQPFLRRALALNLRNAGGETTVELFKPELFFNHLDSIFCVGRWQAGTFVERLGFPEDKIFVTENGCFPELFRPKPRAERVPSMIYSSTPFRGLEHLVSIFPRVRNRVPEAECDVFSGLTVYGATAQEDARAHGDLYRALTEVGVRSHGSVTQAELAKAMCGCSVMAYPNTFEETFCISVLEAQAAGLPVVTSAKGALVERVEHGVDGFLVQGYPKSEKYREEFIGHLVDLYEHPDLWERMSAACMAKAQGFTYDEIARRWEAHFEERGVRGSDPVVGDPAALVPSGGVSIKDPGGSVATLPVDKGTADGFVRSYMSLLGFG